MYATATARNVSVRSGVQRLSVSGDEEAVRTGAAMVLRVCERALEAEEDERGKQQTQAAGRSKLDASQARISSTEHMLT